MKSLNRKIMYKCLVFRCLAILAVLFFGMETQAQNNDDYKSMWSEVNKFENEGLTKSALEVANRIYESAKKSGDQAQKIKALFYIGKGEEVVLENSEWRFEQLLRNEIAESPEPYKSYLQSILAEYYLKFLQNSGYQMSQRTQVVVADDSDFRTWSVAKIEDEIYRLFKLSLQGFDNQQKEVKEALDILIAKGKKDRGLRPLHYDFLAHRLILSLAQYRSQALTSSSAFMQKDKAVFASSKEFVDATFTGQEKDLQLLVVETMQELERLNRDASSILVDNVLTRLNWAKSRSEIANKDECYDEALTDFLNECAEKTESVRIAYLLAAYLQSTDPKRAEELLERAIEQFPKDAYAENCRDLLQKIAFPFLSLEMDKEARPGEKLLAKVSYRNIDKMYFRLIELDRDSFRDLKNAELSRRDKKRKFLLDDRRTVLKEWDQHLPDKGDRILRNVILEIPDMVKGKYALLTSTSPNFSEKDILQSNLIQISNLLFLNRPNEDETFDLIVVDRSNGEPVADAQITLFESKYRGRREGNTLIQKDLSKSDSKGRAKLRLENSYGFHIELEKDLDHLFVETHFQKNYNGRGQFDQVRFFTDRALYRPGQTVHFKGIYLKPVNNQYQIQAGEQVKVSFNDANYEELETQEFTSNEFGSFNGSFVIPTGRINGTYYLRCALGNHQIQVEEYKRPKFEVNLEQPQDELKLNADISIEGSAKSYVGLPIADAEVSYRVVREPYYVYWCWYGGPSQGSNKVEVTNGELVTDAEGKFTIPFNALAPEDSKINYRYRVIASITDSNGETRSDELSVRIGKRSMFVRIEMPERIVVGDEFLQEITAINLNEQKLDAALSYEIYSADLSKTARRESSLLERGKLDSIFISQSDFQRDFSQYNYPADGKKGSLASSGSVKFRDDKTAGIEDLEKLKPGVYTLVVKGLDNEGQESRAEKEFVVLERKQAEAIPLSWFYSDITEGRLLQKDAQQLLIGSPYKIIAHITVHTEGGQVLDKQISLDNSQVLVDLNLPRNYIGSISVNCFAVWENETKQQTFNLEYIEREPKLNYVLSTFRDNLRPGEKEKWRITISGDDNEVVSAELLSTMYDASLDAFRPHAWRPNMILRRYVRSKSAWTIPYGSYLRATRLADRKYKRYNSWYEEYPNLSWFGFYPHNNFWGREMMLEEVAVVGLGKQSKRESRTAAAMAAPPEAGFMVDFDDSASTGAPGGGADADAQPPKVKMRTNLQETAFFFPELRTNEKGEIVLEFEAPEALTKWKWMNFAHSKELDTALWTEEVVTKKELMVTPNAPRFMRQGDQLVYSAKVSNLSDTNQSGKMYLELIDPLTEKSVNHLFKHEQLSQDFNLAPDESAAYDWSLDIPDGISALTCRVIADGGKFSDGEATTLPILTDMVLVTETLPMPQRKAGKKTFELDKLLGSSTSSSIKHHRVSLEYASNPSWYAVQALPSLMEYPYACSEQVFNRMYAYALAEHITNEYPAIEKTFNEWKASAESGGEDLLSNLEKNQELKSAILEETPWLRDAKSETARKQRIAELFDRKRVKAQMQKSVKELEQKQLENGAWPWFGGKSPNLFVTQYIVTGFGHLDRLGVRQVAGTKKMLDKAIEYMDARMNERYISMKKDRSLDDFRPTRNTIQYLYARSFFKAKLSAERKEAHDFYYAKAKDHWLKHNFFMQGMIALTAHRAGDTAFAQKILKSLKENTVESEEMGIYFKDLGASWLWSEAPIERHALLIEAFQEINQDTETVDLLKTWLLKQKQVQDWKTTKATADACYALILTGGDWLAKKQVVDIQVGGQDISFDEASAGTGYVKQEWFEAEVAPDLGTVVVNKESDGVSWGALYWQYFEQMEKVEQAETPLSIKKDLFKEINTEEGPQLIPLTPEAKLVRGDLVKVRIEIRVDRDMEFVHLKDQRSSGFEPTDVISQYKYQDGLGYYQMVRDANTNFFFDRLPKGVYVFEYPLRVFHNGDFSNGISTIQCMYAPEYSSHSKGVRVKVAQE